MSNNRFVILLAKSFLALALALVAVLGAGQSLAVQAAALPPTPCTNQGGGVYQCELWATTGTLSLPDGNTLPIWGYSAGAAAPAQLPGPVLIVPQGVQVNVILHNNLPAATSLHFDGQSLRSDLTGIPAGGQKTYSFTVAQAGTFLYEAGAFTNGQYQVAMGMTGALVVRPATAGQAFSSAASAFDDEALVVLSEIDPALNNSANPAAFDLRNFKPAYWLINGKSYPQTDPIEAAPGRRVLLRYVNAGLHTRTMAVLGLYQQTMSLAAAELPFYRSVASENLGPGQTADALLAIPAGAPVGTTYPLYEASMMLYNPGASGFGGMLTFVTTGAAAPGGDVKGPAVSGAALSPNPTTGSMDVTISATVSDAGLGDAAITQAEFFVGAPGANGAGEPLAAVDSAFDTATEAVQGMLTVADLAALQAGSYSIYIHGQDAAGNWGPLNPVVLTLDKQGPEVTGIVFTPGASNGSVAVTLRATGNDSSRGASQVTGGEYFIDINPASPPAEGSGTPLTVNGAAIVASLQGQISAAVMGGLSEGAHTVAVRSRDALLNWGELATATLMVDKTGPAVSSMTVNPASTNGKTSVRVDASLQDSLPVGGVSNLVMAELFINTAGAPGSGLKLFSLDGSLNSPVEAFYGIIPQSQVTALGQGTHTVLVRGKDAAGNWGGLSSATLIVNSAKPVVSGASAAPAALENVGSFTLNATATSAGLRIVAAEWFVVADPGLGRGMPMIASDGLFNSGSEAIKATVNVYGWPAGAYNVYVRAKDEAGAWSLTTSTTVTVTSAGLARADGFESGNARLWNKVTGANLRVNAQGALQGAYGVRITMGNAQAFLTDNSPTAETVYNTRFYFKPVQAVTGTGVVDIFTAQDGTGKIVYRVQYQRASLSVQPQVRLMVLRNGSYLNTTWYNVADSQIHLIEVDWRSGTSVTLRFVVDSTVVSAANMDTSASNIETILFGLSNGQSTLLSGWLNMDSYEARRDRYVGP